MLIMININIHLDSNSQQCFLSNLIKLLQNQQLSSRMIESPIRRKFTNYPKDFLPSQNKTTHPKRFAFNQDYQIELNSIKKYQQSIDDQPQQQLINSQTIQHSINPQNTVLSYTELEQDSPLGYHNASKKPDINSELLKKPRFTLLDKEQITQNQEQVLESSSSPGSIRKQLQNRQIPLPKSSPCQIDLLKINNNVKAKIPNTYIKYKASGQFQGNKWNSSEKDIVDSFKTSRSKIQSVTQLPKVSKATGSQIVSAKQQYDSFRRRQSMGGNFGKMNSLLMSMHQKEGLTPNQLPKFEQSAIQKLKEEINLLTRKKKNIQKKQQSQSQEQESESQTNQKKHQKRQKSRLEQPKTELLVSYRSSLPYLKDLYAKSTHINSYNLIVKIPKLFTEKLIFKQQQKQSLYQTAKVIFQQLNIPCQNLVIKRYTNCTMIVSRNICLIWHFDGKRYLGGWQSEYLDEGFKHGLGLQWQPRKYVYYGEFVKNKKQGLGIYKDRNNSCYIGYWRKGAKIDPEQMAQSHKEFDSQYQREQDEDQFYGSNDNNNAYQFL